MKTYPPIIIVIFLVLGIFSCKNSTIKSNETSFAISDSSIVDSIRISYKNQAITLVKKDDKWLLNNRFVAEPPAISRLLNSLLLLKLKSPLPENAVNIISTEIKNETFIQIFSNNKKLKAFYLGKYTNGSGNYIMLENEETPYIVYIPSYDFDLRKNFETDVKKWQSKILFNFMPEEIVFVQIDNLTKNKSFSISRINEQFRISDLIENKEIIKSQNENIDYYLSRFQNVMIDNIFENINQKVIDSLLSEKAIFNIKITDIYGNSTDLKAYNFVINNKIDRNKFLGLVDSQQLVLAKFYDFDLIMKDFEYFEK